MHIAVVYIDYLIKILWHIHNNIIIIYALYYIAIDRGIPTRSAFFGEGRGPVHLSRAGCTSEDTDLLSCTIDRSAVNGCDHSEDAGVICRGVCVLLCVYVHMWVL